MNYTTDSSFLMMLLVLPSLFGTTLIGEGVSKIMNYDNHGWIGIGAGSVFVVTIVIVYFTVSTKIIG